MKKLQYNRPPPSRTRAQSAIRSAVWRLTPLPAPPIILKRLAVFLLGDILVMKSKFLVLAACAALLVAALPALAHHSFAAEYDIHKPCKMTGVVTKIALTNPHSWIYI